MKKIIILGSRNFGEKNNPAKLRRELASRLESVEVTQCFFEDLVFFVSNGSQKIVCADGQELKDADLVIAIGWYKSKLRDIAYTVALYLKENDVKFWNSEMLNQRSSTKLSTLWLLAGANVPVSDTIFSLNGDILASNWPGGQVIVKDIAASRGRGNYLAKSKAELQKILEKWPGRYLVQNFEPNDYDIRLVCFGGEPRLAIKRQRADSSTHLNNTSKGGEATLLPLNEIPKTVLDKARGICRLMGREMAGIDFLVANTIPKRYICLEVNAVPQLTSGSFTEEKYSQLAELLKGI